MRKLVLYMVPDKLLTGIDEDTLVVLFNAIDENRELVSVEIHLTDISYVDMMIEALLATKKIYMSTDEHIENNDIPQ